MWRSESDTVGTSASAESGEAESQWEFPGDFIGDILGDFPDIMQPSNVRLCCFPNNILINSTLSSQHSTYHHDAVDYIAYSSFRDYSSLMRNPFTQAEIMKVQGNDLCGYCTVLA